MKAVQKMARVVRTVRRAKASWQALGRSKKGSIAMMAAASIPTLIMLGGLSVDQSYVNVRISMLRHTAQDAALAGGQYLSTYYTSGSSSTIVNAAQAIAVEPRQRLPQYGTVVPASRRCTGHLEFLDQDVYRDDHQPDRGAGYRAKYSRQRQSGQLTIFGGAYGVPTVNLNIERGRWLWHRQGLQHDHSE